MDLKIYLFFRLKESEMKIIEFLHKYFIKFGELSNKLNIYLFCFAFQQPYCVVDLVLGNKSLKINFKTQSFDVTLVCIKASL